MLPNFQRVLAPSLAVFQFCLVNPCLDSDLQQKKRDRAYGQQPGLVGGEGGDQTGSNTQVTAFQGSCLYGTVYFSVCGNLDNVSYTLIKNEEV